MSGVRHMQLSIMRTGANTEGHWRVPKFLEKLGETHGVDLAAMYAQTAALDITQDAMHAMRDQLTRDPSGVTSAMDDELASDHGAAACCDVQVMSGMTSCSVRDRDNQSAAVELSKEVAKLRGQGSVCRAMVVLGADQHWPCNSTDSIEFFQGRQHKMQHVLWAEAGAVSGVMILRHNRAPSRLVTR
eukprot:jgi/Chrzof1/12405/Cz06g33090.t1